MQENEADKSKAIILAVNDMAAHIPFFPAADSERESVMRYLDRICPSPASVRFVALMAIEHMPKWLGGNGLRAILCQRFRPLDGIEADVSPDDMPKLANRIEQRAIEQHEQKKYLSSPQALRLLSEAKKGKSS